MKLQRRHKSKTISRCSSDKKGTVSKQGVLFFMIILSTFIAKAQKGLHVKLSLGTGFTTEYSGINKLGLSIVTKNHTVGWGITENFGLHIGELGSLNKIETEGYQYINTDGFGVGFSCRIAMGVKISTLIAYSKVSYEEKWWTTDGEVRGKGIGANLSLDKEWFVAKRWGVRLGPHVYWVKTHDAEYEFFNISINGSIVFYLNPEK